MVVLRTYILRFKEFYLIVVLISPTFSVHLIILILFHVLGGLLAFSMLYVYTLLYTPIRLPFLLLAKDTDYHFLCTLFVLQKERGLKLSVRLGALKPV